MVTSFETGSALGQCQGIHYPHGLLAREADSKLLNAQSTLRGEAYWKACVHFFHLVPSSVQFPTVGTKVGTVLYIWYQIRYSFMHLVPNQIPRQQITQCTVNTECRKSLHGILGLCTFLTFGTKFGTVSCFWYQNRYSFMHSLTNLVQFIGDLDSKDISKGGYEERSVFCKQCRTLLMELSAKELNISALNSGEVFHGIRPTRN